MTIRVGFALISSALLLTSAPWGRAESITASLSKIADLPLYDFESPETSPQSPRGGILQLGNELWFTTYSGGDHSVGAIVSYNLNTGVFTTQHSFGLPVPGDPSSARKDGINPWKTTLTLAPDGHTIYYSTSFGGAASTGNNGGAVGVFNRNTIQTAGVTVLWSGGTTGTQPRNVGYSSPIYVPTATGSSLYFTTYQGGSGSGGTVQKVSLDISGALVSSTEITAFTGPNGKLPQGGMLQVGTKLYYTTGTSASASPTLQVLDTTTDTVSILSSNWTIPGHNNAGGWSTPVYDALHQAIYSVALNGGLLKWDLNSQSMSVLDGGADVSGNNFANPVLFGDSIYYLKQNGGIGGTSGQVWRFDLGLSTNYLLFDLASMSDAKASVQSGSLSIGHVGGQDVLLFTTADDNTGNSFGGIYKIVITPVPEPGAVSLLILSSGLLAFSRRRCARQA